MKEKKEKEKTKQ